jgi:hypothetical protein
VPENTVESAHAWIEGTLASIQSQFVAAHPEHRTPVRAALETIAENPYALPLRPYNGLDAPAATYVYRIPRTRVELVFSIFKGPPPNLALYQLLDWEDMPVTG